MLTEKESDAAGTSRCGLGLPFSMTDASCISSGSFAGLSAIALKLAAEIDVDEARFPAAPCRHLAFRPERVSLWRGNVTGVGKQPATCNRWPVLSCRFLDDPISAHTRCAVQIVQKRPAGDKQAHSEPDFYRSMAWGSAPIETPECGHNRHPCDRSRSRHPSKRGISGNELPLSLRRNRKTGPLHTGRHRRFAKVPQATIRIMCRLPAFPQQIAGHGAGRGDKVKRLCGQWRHLSMRNVKWAPGADPDKAMMGQGAWQPKA